MAEDGGFDADTRSRDTETSDTAAGIPPFYSSILFFDRWTCYVTNAPRPHHDRMPSSAQLVPQSFRNFRNRLAGNSPWSVALLGWLRNVLFWAKFLDVFNFIVLFGLYCVRLRNFLDLTEYDTLGSSLRKILDEQLFLMWRLVRIFLFRSCPAYPARHCPGCGHLPTLRQYIAQDKWTSCRL